jgi:hypothetical protein
LHDEIRQLKAAGSVIRYRRGEAPGYVWDGPHGIVDSEALGRRIELVDPAYIEAVARLTPREKLARAKGMARWARPLLAGREE